MAISSTKTTHTDNLGFEAKLFLTADKLRGSMDASDYKHVALGLVSSNTSPMLSAPFLLNFEK